MRSSKDMYMYLSVQMAPLGMVKLTTRKKSVCYNVLNCYDRPSLLC